MKIEVNIVVLKELLLLLLHIVQSASSGDIRLVSPLNNGVGRIEVYYNGVWGTVCDDDFTDQAAKVACQHLGMFQEGFQPKMLLHFGFGTGQIWLDDVNCTGTESSLASCSHRALGMHNCNHREDVGVICDERRVTVKLGSGYSSGLLNVSHGGMWGTVCYHNFGKVEATVICRTLGYESGEATGVGSANRVLLDNVKCSMNDADLKDCAHNGWGNYSCRSNKVVRLECYSIPEARLLSGGSETRGRLEILHKYQWGTVCDLGFTNISAKIACKMVGQPDQHAYFTPGGSYGSGTGQVWLSNVQCKGSEGSLGECSHSTLGTTCSHSQDVGIVCSYSPEIHLDPSSNVLSINEGNDLVVECVVDDANPGVRTFTWSYKGGLTYGRIFRISNVSRSDKGNLSCSADNGLGMNPGRAETVIDVLYPPEVYLMPNSSHDFINVVLGEDLTVDCVVTDANPDPVSLTWLHHGHSSSGATFHLQNVTYSHEGRLTCTADNGVGTSPGRADTFIRVVEKSLGPIKAEVKSSDNGSSKWTMIHTAAVVTGGVAGLIIVVLAIMLLYLYRKRGSVPAQNEWQRKPNMIAASNPVYDKEEEAVYDVPDNEITMQPTPKFQNKVREDLKRKPNETKATIFKTSDQDESEEVYENSGTIEKAKSKASQVQKSGPDYYYGGVPVKKDKNGDEDSEEDVYENF